jgi:predicted porin
MSTPIRGRSLASAAAALAVLAADASAFEAKISGHVNRLIMQVDDGEQSKLFHADNVNSQTRFRFTGTHDVTTGLKAGINWEVGYTSNPSSRISMTSRSVDATFNERHAEIFFLGNWGKLSFGQGDGAANGGMEVDLSGTAVINYSGIADIGGNFAFRQATAFAPTIAGTIDNLDFESRYDRIRYDSPVFGPAKLAVSYGTKGNNDVTEVALWIAHAFAGGKLAGAIGWSNEDRGAIFGNEDTVGASFSWLHGSGFNLTLGYANLDDDNPATDKRKFSYAKAGYLSGKHAVSVDYGRGKNFGINGDDADVIGIGYVYTAQKWLELYAGYKQHSLDRTGANFDDIRFLIAGTRIKF